MADVNKKDVKKIATRESYGNALLELVAENPDVVVLDADLNVKSVFFHGRQVV